MRFWFDTEFIEDGRTIDLISIGIVSEYGHEYYAESAAADLGKASDWVRRNVLPHLTGEKKARDLIAKEIVEFCGLDPEFWAYYADYDWVVMCQLFGTMMQLPAHWPKFCLDIQQRRHECGNPVLPKQATGLHSALHDARWNRQAWDYLEKLRTPA